MSASTPETRLDRVVAVRKLVDRLASGRSLADAALAEHVRVLWSRVFQVSATDVRSGAASITLTTGLPEIRLRGVDDIRVLIMLGEPCAWGREAHDFLRRCPPSCIPVLVALTPQARAHAAAMASGDATLLLGTEEIASLLEAEDPRATFHRMLLERVPAHHLNPFDYLKPVDGSMFAGRKQDLNTLRYEADTSFAVPGPGRLGKSSLLRRYRRDLVHRRDPRAAATFYIDWMDCHDLSYSGVATHLARHFGDSALDRREATVSLTAYVKRVCEQLNQPLNLLCDETDRVCSTPAFLDLGSAARRGHCRMVLAGRAELLRWLNQGQSPLAARLSLLRLEPLDETSARSLLMDPLHHLGLQAPDEEGFTRAVLDWTGRMPHLIQYYGQRLARRAIATGGVDLELARRVHEEMETATYLTSSLQDITDPLARLLALGLLRDNPARISISAIMDLARREGVGDVSHQRSVEIAEELVICNVLIWRGGEYRLSSQSLREHAARLGYLEHGLQEARVRLHAKRAAASPYRLPQEPAE